MGLQTILWKFDSDDWEEGENGVTKATVDNNYAQLIAKLNAGQFNEFGAIILAHELSQFTMQEAIDWYSRLNAAFSVRNIPRDHIYLTQRR